MTVHRQPGPVINLADLSIRPPNPARGTPPDGYDVRGADIASRIGARKLGYNLAVVAPGKRNCPFHNHHIEEEMFFILEGTGELRYGKQRLPLKSGDIVACPPGGPETAHQIINTGDTEMRYLAVSTMAAAEICEYPDSGKFGAFGAGTPDTEGQPPFRYIGTTGDRHDYWEGE